MSTIRLFADQQEGSVGRVISANSVDGHAGIGARCVRILGREPNDTFKLELHPLIALSYEFVRNEKGIFQYDPQDADNWMAGIKLKWTCKTIYGWRAFVAWLYAYLFMRGC